ncbi:Dormancy-associated protein-like protein [Thalictrum thalictroides]|uniref:Dormancy-associated protein-like protein n=1 Tax=Thalictrum thalictroides TaxID=46969 RepID=A0A7J6URJ0_THATH|nr:Dormancy-associated protein-like protein [Thalictrum thalictroides]
MVLLDKLWDDVSGGPSPDHGLGRLRKLATNKPLIIKGTPVTPVTPTTPKENVWRSVFHPGSNIATKHIGSAVFDKPQPNSPSVYDWLYSGDTRSKHHR